MNNKKLMGKSGKESFNMEIEKWPEELERIAEEINNNYGLIMENITSIEDFKKYAESCIPWEEYKKEWML